MIERGVVSRVEGETADVVFKRSSACGKCQACGRLKDMSEITVDVKNTLRAGPGDRVEICLLYTSSSAGWKSGRIIGARR